jgi:hypothetical protein
LQPPAADEIYVPGKPREDEMKSTALIVAGLCLAAAAAAGAPELQKWQKGKGWGWVWGPQDEVGSLNEMTDASRLAALKLAKTGKVYDLGVLYDRTSYKWPGHSPGEIMAFRTPEGVKHRRTSRA